MSTTRRQFLTGAASAIAVSNTGALVSAQDAPKVEAKPGIHNRIGLASYSLWQFKNDDLRDLKLNLDLAAQFGFAGLEVLERQFEPGQVKDAAYLQGLKRHAAINGLDLYGMATHQTFLTPKPEVRQQNIEMTIGYLELAYQLGIPTMRVQTGTWGTSKNFDDLMAHRGIEPPIEGHNDEEGFKWVIDCFEKCIPTAERNGVTMGLENHWGLGRTPGGVKRIVESVGSPWLRATCDVGNFLEDPYEKLEVIAPLASMVHMKTYYGGGLWYTLKLDYPRIVKMLQKVGYHGYLSLEFEGKEDPRTGVPRSLARIQKAYLEAEGSV
jgi:L-ribulose-5-phosphate 3-epimerase